MKSFKPLKMKLTEPEIRARIQKKHGTTVDIDMSTYVNARTPARFIDIDYGDWWTQPGAVFRGSRHKQRFIDSRKIPLKEVQKRLSDCHGGLISINSEEYVHTYKKCTFYDPEYGSWQAYPHNVLNGSTHPLRGLKRRQNTWLRAYGVDNPFKSQHVQDKASKSRNRSVHFTHWKTGKDLACVSSYEASFVLWCDENRIDFDWQIWYELPNDTKYRVDAYIKDGIYVDTWIEIKGYARPDFQEKWALFKEIQPNSEIWDQQKLTELGVLAANGRPRKSVLDQLNNEPWKAFKRPPFSGTHRQKISESLKKYHENHKHQNKIV